MSTKGHTYLNKVCLSMYDLLKQTMGYWVTIFCWFQQNILIKTKSKFFFRKEYYWVNVFFADISKIFWKNTIYRNIFRKNTTYLNQ